MLYADNLEEFGRLVSGSDDNFSLNTPLCNSVIWCTQVRVGNAKFIYAAGAADDSSMVPDYKAVMVAVVADNRIYLTQSIYNLTNKAILFSAPEASRIESGRSKNSDATMR